MLRKILFVDDDQILRSDVVKHLETYSEHFATVVASDGFDAAKKLEKMPFSLVILDLIMPRMDGMSLISHIRDTYPDIPIGIISEMPIDKMQHLAAASDIVAYLSKPFQTSELAAIIMHTLRKEAEGGIMHDVSPAVFLQLMEMDVKTCTIRILDKKSKQGGILYFIDGRLVHARIGALHGINAALKVFTWDAVTIFFRNDCPPQEDTINSGLQPIIMKAAGMKDESEGLEESEDNDGRPATLAVTNTPDDSRLANDSPSGLSFNQETTGVSIDDADKVEKPATSPLDGLKNLLKKTAGIHCSIEDIRHDEAMDIVVSQLNALGMSSQFANFQVAYIGTDKAYNRILLPGPPPALVNIPADSPRDTIIELLRRVDSRH
jgi:CheY-like chemotaxis protein